MNDRTSGLVLAALLAIAPLGCGDDGDGTASDSDGTSSTTDAESTLPITISDSAATSSVSDTTGSTTDDPTSTSTTEDATGTSDDATGGSGSTSDDSTTRGLDPVEIEWCILQYPATIPDPPTIPAPVTSGEPITIYTRFYVEGVTDQTEFNDEDDRIVVEFGYGADGSDPAVDPWTWSAGEPNPGWDGSMAGGFGNENNDEYRGDISFAEGGTFDYAVRISGDGGTTWEHCDLDDNQTGGYTADMAGDATIMGG